MYRWKSEVLFPQQIFKEETLVVNVEVPVRVFKDGKFMDNLTINDFLFFEISEYSPKLGEAIEFFAVFFARSFA